MTTLVERFNRLVFRAVVKGVLETPPVRPGRRPFIALSMVHHRDVLPYLLAIKTFIRCAGPARVVVIADPTLDEGDCGVLRQHVPGLEVLVASGFRRAALPVGGTWERLAAISVLCSELPVVQLDSDTLTLGSPAAVLQAVSENSGFIIRSEAGVEISTLDAAAVVGQQLMKTSRHIQAVAEARLTDLPDWRAYRYVRGCSGFTGFARGSIDPTKLDAVSEQMTAIHHERWNDWGTEQITSNLLAATAGAILLPHPEYCNADAFAPNTVLTHFIGYARHVNRRYEQLAGSAIKMLRSAG